MNNLFNHYFSNGMSAFNGGNLRLARKNFKEAIKYGPDNLNLLQIYAFIESKFENYEKANKLSLKALALEPTNPDLINNYALSLIWLNQLDKAKLVLVDCLERNPTHTLTKINLAKLLMGKNKFDEAINLLENLDLSNFDILLNLAKCYLAVGNIEVARPLFLKVREAYPQEKTATFFFENY